jgi:hypothetical protein
MNTRLSNILSLIIVIVLGLLLSIKKEQTPVGTVLNLAQSD